jgi:hypothetical protein
MHGLLNDAPSSSDHIAFNIRMTESSWKQFSKKLPWPVPR